MGAIMLKYVLILQIILSYRANVLICVTATQLNFLWNHAIYIFISHLVSQTIGSHIAW